MNTGDIVLVCIVCFIFGAAGMVWLVIFFDKVDTRQAQSPDALRREELAQAEHNLRMMRIQAEEAALIEKMKEG